MSYTSGVRGSVPPQRSTFDRAPKFPMIRLLDLQGGECGVHATSAWPSEYRKARASYQPYSCGWTNDASGPSLGPRGATQSANDMSSYHGAQKANGDSSCYAQLITGDCGPVQPVSEEAPSYPNSNQIGKTATVRAASAHVSFSAPIHSPCEGQTYAAPLSLEIVPRKTFFSFEAFTDHRLVAQPTMASACQLSKPAWQRIYSSPTRFSLHMVGTYAHNSSSRSVRVTHPNVEIAIDD